MIWLKALQARLITHFSVEQKLVTAGQIYDLARLSLTQQVLVGRDYCQYACLNLAHIPNSKRTQALRLQIESLSSWSSTGCSIAWKQGFAQVWFWNADAVNELLLSGAPNVSLRAKLSTFLSEIVYLEPPSTSGFFLYELQNGYDLQYWSEGVLRASQWYAAKPLLDKTQRFMRAQGLLVANEELQAIVPNKIDKPWAGVNTSMLGYFFERKSQIIAAAVALSVLLLSAQVTAIARWSWEVSDLEHQTHILSQSATQLLEARNSARADTREIKALERLISIPDPLSSQMKIYKHVPANLKLSLLTWERNIDQVDITIEGVIPDTLSVVKAFEKDAIKNVRVDPIAGNNKYRIRLVLGGYENSLADIQK